MKTDPAKIPTGYAPTALPFYSGMDDAGFEQFCTDLLNLHPAIHCLRDNVPITRRIVTAHRLLSGTSQKGADIRAEAEAGEVWFFQCKHTQAFGPSDVAEAVRLAEASLPHADQFVLVTTCGLSEDAQSRLGKRWLWWDGSRLTTETIRLRPREDAINLVHCYFGSDWKKALFSSHDQPLLTWQEYFEQDLSPERKHFHHRTSFTRSGDTLGQLESFAQSGAGKVTILSAAGGQGKSRLLLELARKLESQDNVPRVRFLNLNRHGLSSEQFGFLAREEDNLVLIVDDAHRLDGAVEDVARATARVKSIRLIISTRPQALEAVTKRLFDSGYAERLEKNIVLPPWKQAEIHHLAEQVLTPSVQSQATRLANLADRCPLLVVIGGELINSGTWPEAMTDEETFRQRVFHGFKEDFLSRITESERGRMGRLIELLSFVSPTPKNDAFFDKAAEILNCSPLDVDSDIDRLQAAGMVIENQEGLRLYPDLFADAVLFDACSDHSNRPSQLYRHIVRKLPSADFPALMRNLAQADWDARVKTGVSSSLFDPIWSEFVQRFKEGIWVNDRILFSELVFDESSGSRKPQNQADRAQLLTNWSSFAVFLPERTLDLALLALQTAASSFLSDAQNTEDHVKEAICHHLPTILKPIVIWHGDFSHSALDILWSLDVDESNPVRENGSSGVKAIADAASFDLHRPLSAAEKILEWIDHKTRDASTFHRLRKQPWILSALLKPFFGREVENSWSAGRTFHFSSLLISAQRTRPLRRKALAIIERFWRYDDVSLRQATIPVLCEAVSPLHGRFGNQPSQTDYDSWQIDRLEALQVIERAATKSSECPALLLQLRSILRDRIEYDPDQVVQDECRGILKKIPDTFELGVARVLTSFSNDEVQLKPGPTLESQLREANRLWSHFRNSIGIEVAKRFPTAGELCEFVRRQVRTLRASNLPVRGDALLESVAMISPLWCSTLLDNLLASRDETLDVFLWPMFHHASINAKESYHRAITSLPLEGRVSQLSSLVNYLGWKHIHGGGMTPFERQALFQATGRTETEVMHELSTIVAYRLSSDQELAIGILKRLTTRNERVADEILVALSQLATASDSILTSADVSLCLKNIGPCCFPETFSDARNLNKIAKLFPRQIYDHVRALHENTSKELDARHPRQLVEPLELGCFKDQSYVEQEIQIHWTEAKSIQPHSFEREYRLSLIQSLLWSDSASAFDRITQLIEASSNIDELIMIAGITATPGSQFVFRSPNLVRRLLSRSDEFFALAKMREALWLSACGGGRSFTNQELDPEYRYVLEQGETLANRYHDDRILGEFYRGIAKSERRNLEWHKSIIAAPELD